MKAYNTKLTKDEAIKLLEKEYPNGVELVSIDYYRDRIENKSQLEELAQTGYINDDEWLFDAQDYGIMDIIEELFGKYEIDDEVREVIVEWCCDNDKSDPIRQLIKNTQLGWYYYDLNCYIGDDSPTKETNKIIKLLGLPKDNKNIRKKIKEMVVSSFYGGDLVVLFVADPLDLYGDRSWVKSIKFNNYKLAIMDRVQGSGDYSETIEGNPIVLNFNSENLHYDDGAPGYSLTGEVCGIPAEQETKWTFKGVKK